MKTKIQLTIGALTILSAGFLAGSYYPINTNLVELQRTKQGLFIITNGNLYTVNMLVTDTDSYQKMERIK
jgi:hypothetical protein